ncbi:hypothetical protein N0V93_002302 [Gnomoniopsis smithogilvyi]|uniref:O-fucosyltransferase family protein n=1 Tax=Gnomoniopsis smithogilvyi TaxID=1191159 RepID=A0A9W8YYI6_9PEZI|nr:hypothetical protein N0V93_002302 [Gnomoniopsis smithogilvyi]
MTCERSPRFTLVPVHSWPCPSGSRKGMAIESLVIKKLQAMNGSFLLRSPLVRDNVRLPYSPLHLNIEVIFRMSLVSPRGTFLRAFLLLSLSLSLIIVFRALYIDESTLLTLSSVNIIRLGEILRQGSDVTKTWSISSTPAEDTTTTLDPSISQGIEDLDEAVFPHLNNLCGSTTWRPNLSLHCHSRCGPDKSSFCGGLNNARDRLQTCVRLAIDAGATTVLIPSIAARSESALWTVDPSAVAEDVGEPIVLCPEAWFSLGRLQQALSNACNKLKVESVCPIENGLVDLLEGPTPSILQMPWRSFDGQRFDIRPGRTFREAVDEALTQNHGEADSVLVDYGDPYIAWNSTYGDEIYTVYKDLFRAVGYNEDLRALGERVVSSPRLKDTPYIGVHLRGENDWPEEWGSLEEQTALYASEIQQIEEQSGDVRTVYVSCGNRNSIQYFRQAVEPLGYAVLDKWTVFETDWPEGLDVVESLPFDQKAVVEYETLVAGRYFLGIRLSSMSVVIATQRTLAEPGDFLETYVDNIDLDLENKTRRLEVRGNKYTRLLSISGIAW